MVFIMQSITSTTHSNFSITTPEVTGKRKAEIVFKDNNKNEKNIVSLKKRKVTKKTHEKSFNFIFDESTSVRGDPVMLEISCRKCSNWVMDYQKDGPGNLLRCYVDRIYHPRALREKQFTYRNITTIESLQCSNCASVLAIPIIYRRTKPSLEIRAAYKIEADRIRGQIIPRIMIRKRVE